MRTTEVSILAYHIKTLRREFDLTLDELADAASCSKSYVWGLENRPNMRPSVHKLAKIARVFCVTVDYLIGSGKFSRQDVTDIAFLREYRQLPVNVRHQVREIAKILAEFNTTSPLDSLVGTKFVGKVKKRGTEC